MNRFGLVVLSTIAVSTSASAQQYAYPSSYPGAYPPFADAPYRGVYPDQNYRGRAFGAPSAYCQKLCIQDFAPCDPPEYKHADGRCTNPARGRGS